jgi:hypothetical protein
MGINVDTPPASSRRQSHWEKSSSIRSRPRRVLRGWSPGEHFYPVARQPIALHPMVIEKGDGARDHVLLQSLYKFLNDIAFVETRVVNEVALAIANDQLPWPFPPELRTDVLTVLIDEGYHAYVAIDFMEQVRRLTGVDPLTLPPTLTIEQAIANALPKLPAELHPALKTIAVCIAENSVTKELIDVHREEGLNETFHAVNSDHMVDEVRHCLIFADVLKHLWGILTTGQRRAIGVILPDFLGDYLTLSLQKQFDMQILASIGLNAAEIESVIAATHLDQDLASYRNVNPIVDKVVTFLRECGVLDDQEIRATFAEKRLI